LRENKFGGLWSHHHIANLLGQNGCGRTKRERMVKWLEIKQGWLLKVLSRKRG
jgi:hypothetical protein